MLFRSVAELFTTFPELSDFRRTFAARISSFEQDGAVDNFVSYGHEYRRDGQIAVGCDGVFHLHRLDDEQLGARTNELAIRGMHLHHGANER